MTNKREEEYVATDGTVKARKVQDDDDEDDALTVYQANYMSNIAPQHKNFNRNNGLWWRLEGWVRGLVDVHHKQDVWIIAGCIFGPGKHEEIRPNSNIVVPPMFYKIVVMENPQPGQQEPIVLAFLFPHQRVKHGDTEDFLVSVDVIEALTGEDFLNELPDDLEKTLEKKDTWETWEQRATWLPE